MPKIPLPQRARAPGGRRLRGLDELGDVPREDGGRDGRLDRRRGAGRRDELQSPEHAGPLSAHLERAGRGLWRPPNDKSAVVRGVRQSRMRCWIPTILTVLFATDETAETLPIETPQ